MKLAMQLTLDGLVRALRLKAHGLADEIEDGYRRGRRELDGETLSPADAANPGRERDDGARR